MFVKSVFSSFLLSTALISSASFAMEDKDLPEGCPGFAKAASLKTRSFANQKKIELLTILQDNQGNPISYHKGYESFADEIISYAEESINASDGKLNENLSDLDIIKGQVRTYCDDKTLNLPTLSWLSLQVGMVLTPAEDRDRKGQGKALIELLNGFEPPKFKDETLRPAMYFPPAKRIGLKEEYLQPYSRKLETPKQLGFDKIFSQRLYYPLVLVGGGRFSDKDFLDLYRDKIYLSVLANQKELPRYGVHGGNFLTPIEVLLHDFAHLSEPFDFNAKGIWMQNGEAQKEWISAAMYITSTTQQMFESSIFTPEEKQKLSFLTFFGVHEIDTSIEKRALRQTQYYAWSVNDKTALNLKLIESFLKDIDDYGTKVESDLAKLQDELEKAQEAVQNAVKSEIAFGSSRATTKQIEDKNNELNNIHERINSRMRFHRDLAYMLIKLKVLEEAGVRKEGSKRLGVTYKIAPVISALKSMTAWMRAELKLDNSRMLPFFESQEKKL